MIEPVSYQNSKVYYTRDLIKDNSVVNGNNKTSRRTTLYNFIREGKLKAENVTPEGRATYMIKGADINKFKKHYGNNNNKSRKAK